MDSNSLLNSFVNKTIKRNKLMINQKKSDPSLLPFVLNNRAGDNKMRKLSTNNIKKYNKLNKKINFKKLYSQGVYLNNGFGSKWHIKQTSFRLKSFFKSARKFSMFAIIFKKKIKILT